MYRYRCNVNHPVVSIHEFRIVTVWYGMKVINNFYRSSIRKRCPSCSILRQIKEKFLISHLEVIIPIAISAKKFKMKLAFSTLAFFFFIIISHSDLITRSRELLNWLPSAVLFFLFLFFNSTKKNLWKTLLLTNF